MDELLEASARFPTVVFTIGLGIALIYWLFVLIGALDIDVLGGADGGDAGADGDGGGALAKIGLGAVPITISVSLIMLVGWIGSLLAMKYAPDTTWTALVVLPGMLIFSMLVTNVLVRPLAPAFRLREGKSNRDYVGHTCTITTGHVDDGFGQATVEDGGTVLVIPVRCDRPGKLSRNDKALIIDFDETRQAYLVEPTTDMLPGPGEAA